METTIQIHDLELSKIKQSSTNQMFRGEDLLIGDDFISSIRDKGVLQPILVRPVNSHYEVVFGERRYQASQVIMKAFKDRNTIPAQIRELTDDQALDLQIEENLHRENINPMKEALAFAWIIKDKKISSKMLAEKIGKSVDYIEERIRLSKLHPDAQKFVRDGVLPLKAGLKLASVPAELQKKALDNCIEAVEGANGITHTFTGLERLQNWLGWNVFNELAHADFDIADAKLMPAAGSCSTCMKRTKNAGGLFDDVAKKDFCFDGGCFRQKQLAQYAILKNELQLKYPGVEIAYRHRGHGQQDSAFKKLQPVISSYDGSEVGHTKMLELMKKKGAKIKVAILVGLNRHGDDAKKRFLCLSFEKQNSSGGYSAPKKDKATVEKERNEKRKSTQYEFFLKKLTSETLIKKAATKTLSQNLLEDTVMSVFGFNDVDDIVPALVSLGVDFSMGKYVNGKRQRVQIKAAEFIADKFEDYSMNDDDLALAIEGLKSEKLNALLAWGLYQNKWGQDQKDFLSLLKVDVKSVNDQAKKLTADWWKVEQERAKTLKPLQKPVKDLVKKLVKK